MPSLDQIQSFISNLGFPIFMALYFMYAQQQAEKRQQKLLEELECVQSQLTETKLQVGQVLPAATSHFESLSEQKEDVTK
jgi:hypothetical protein